MFDPKEAKGQKARSSGRAPRPKDAATLVIVDRDGPQPRILMGKRSAGHDFMPNKFVFPGGRVDIGDSRLAIENRLHPEVEARLVTHCSVQKARGLALAAIRETFEEVGLLIGKPGASMPRTKSQAWNAFFNHGVIPAVEELDLIARAITPPYRHKRFDARFFMVDATAIHNPGNKPVQSSDELLEVHWFTLEEASGLDLPNITRLMLAEVKQRVSRHQPKSAKGPFTYFRHGKPVRDEI